MLRRSSVLLLAMAVVALGGCGSSGSSTNTTTALSKSQYQAELSAGNKKVTEANHALRSALSSQGATPAKVSSAMESYANAQQQLGDHYAGLQPPANAQSANALLAKGFHDEAAEARSLAAKLKSAKSRSEVVAIFKQAGSTTTGGKEVDQAIKQLHSLGYANLG